MTAQQERKQHIRAFMRAHYTDERLAQLLAHAQDGKLDFYSCCCFIGIATATHAIRARLDRETDFDNPEAQHLFVARELPGADQAEDAFRKLCGGLYGDREPDKGRRVLIPIIRAEMKRRSALAALPDFQEFAQRVAEPCVPIFEEDCEVVA